MITEPRALQDTYVPRDLVHREGEIETLAAALQPLAHGLQGEHTFVFGPPGSGKTTLARYVAEEVAQETPGLRYGYVNCLSASTPNSVLATLGRELGVSARRSEGTARQSLLARFRDAEQPLLAILDEVHGLSDLALLRTLYAVDGLTLVCIALDEDRLFATPDLQPQTRSRLRAFELIRLTSYSRAELVDILEYRVEHGLDQRRVADDALTTIAARAAGDARDAIAMLRRAAREAAATGRDIDPALVAQIQDDARETVRRSRVQSLGTHRRALYTIIERAGEDGIDAHTLHERYETRVQKPVSKRTRRRHLESLVNSDLVERSGRGRGTRYYRSS